MNWNALAEIFKALAMLAVALGTFFNAKAIQAVHQEVIRNSIDHSLTQSECVCPKK